MYIFLSQFLLCYVLNKTIKPIIYETKFIYMIARGPRNITPRAYGGWNPSVKSYRGWSLARCFIPVFTCWCSITIGNIPDSVWSPVIGPMKMYFTRAEGMGLSASYAIFVIIPTDRPYCWNRGQIACQCRLGWSSTRKHMLNKHWTLITSRRPTAQHHLRAGLCLGNCRYLAHRYG